MADREFLLKVIGDVSNAQKSLGKLESDVNTTKNTLTGAATAIGGAFAVGAIVDFGKGAVDAASQAEQAWGAVDSVFGDYATSIHDASSNAAKDLGLAQGQYEELATLTGALLKNAGVPLDEVAASTENLTQVGADLSAMYGGTVADAMGAINSALKGEMDPLESFGVSLKASAIEAKAVAMGLVDAEGKATDYGKKMATVALIQEQSADAAGTFAKESKSLAGQTQILKARFTDVQAELGTKLMPIIVTFAEVLMGLIGFVEQNQDWLLPIVTAVGAFAAVIGTVIVATKTWTIIQGAFNAVMMMNPVVLVVAAIAALVAGIILAYNKVDWFREFVDKSFAAMVDAFNWVVDAAKDVWEAIKFVWDWVKNNWPLLLAIITGPFGLAVWAIQRYWDDIKRGVQTVIESIRVFFTELPGKIGEALSTVWDKVTSPFRTAYDWVNNNVFTPIHNWIWGFPSMINDAWNGLDDVLFYPFKAAFNAIKNWWNSTVGGFGFSVPGWVPLAGGKSFNIPRMAAGGIVTRPTIAMIGEAGREAVIPLDRMGFGNVTINVYALTANAEVGRQVFNALREYERSTGKSIGGATTTTTGVFAA